LWQAHHVAQRLHDSNEGEALEVEIVIIETTGDRDTASPLHSIGGKGVFVKEVQVALLDGRADIAVHSAKDLPAETPPGLVLASIPTRGDPRDALVGSTLDGLAQGARVATGSVRRRAQLYALRPDLEFHELRGNIATRLGKASDFDAIVIAATALVRLDEHPHVVDTLSVEAMVPQVGQAALAVECRADDAVTSAALTAIDDPFHGPLVRAERSFLHELGGDCSLPAAAHARYADPASTAPSSSWRASSHQRT
jgi:hydroxymethylbilane synthase